MSGVEERTYVEASRREKRAALEALRRAGVRLPVRALPHRRARRSRSTATSRARTAPRSSSRDGSSRLRHQGKTAFAHLEDGSGRIQVYFRRDRLGPAWELVELLDLDDHVGIRGRLFRTRKGEITVRAEGPAAEARSTGPRRPS